MTGLLSLFLFNLIIRGKIVWQICVYNQIDIPILPSSKLIITLENRDYMAIMKEKLLEIKRFYRNLELAPMAGQC